jgi:hypothetical protein
MDLGLQMKANQDRRSKIPNRGISVGFGRNRWALSRAALILHINMYVIYYLFDK